MHGVGWNRGKSVNGSSRDNVISHGEEVAREVVRAAFMCFGVLFYYVQY
jgi:hypothetical protein